MNQIEINEIVNAANIYLTRLKFLNKELDLAFNQIEHTYEETQINIRQAFNKLKQALLDVLLKRENELLEKAEFTKSESLAPLRECRAYISEKIESTVKLINTGTSILNDKKANWEKFSKSARFLGSLPEVPELRDVPYLSFYYEPLLEIDIISKAAHLGDIYKIPPTQISDFTEKPGAILVDWKIVVDNDEKVVDVEEFCLQKAFGDVTKDKTLIANFHDCYKGLDAQFLVKDLQDHQPYSFRVCCRFEGCTEWCPWSLAQVASTSLKHFTWEHNSNYEFSNDYKVAKPKVNDADMLYSDGAQFAAGHSIDFMFIECDSSYAVVGLVSGSPNKLPKSVKDSKGKTFLMNNSGKILIDGEEKSTVLPEFHSGSKVTFNCSLAKERYVRVSIDCKDKRVTYDWAVSPTSKIYFVSQFFSDKWKVMIE